VSVVDVAIIAVSGLVGWGLVWGLITVIHQQKKPPYDPHAAGRTGGPSLAELGEQWHRILEVPLDASLEQIESAYQARLAECDRLTDSVAAQKRRSDVVAAFEFIRASR
jgi:hypothetical protein